MSLKATQSAGNLDTFLMGSRAQMVTRAGINLRFLVDAAHDRDEPTFTMGLYR